MGTTVLGKGLNELIEVLMVRDALFVDEMLVNDPRINDGKEEDGQKLSTCVLGCSMQKAVVEVEGIGLVDEAKSGNNPDGKHAPLR